LTLLRKDKRMMASTNAQPRIVVCLASYFKGNDFIRECKRQGCRVILLTREKMLRFRDKLAMRFKAQEAAVVQPEFAHLLNYQELGEYLERIPPPWILKPRADASSIGIKRLDEPEQAWCTKGLLDARESLRERSSYYPLERFIPGDVYHVNSLTAGG
jgi:biotin carboxylase